MRVVKIDKAIPLQTKRETRYPWNEMDVGDSFLFPANSNGASSISHANRRYAPRKFVSRKTDEGLRCWRVA